MWSQGADASTLGSVREGSHSWTAASTFHLIENTRICGVIGETIFGHPAKAPATCAAWVLRRPIGSSRQAVVAEGIFVGHLACDQFLHVS